MTSVADQRELFESAKRFSHQFRGLLLAAEAWEGVASIEQATAEAKARLAKAKISQAEIDALTKKRDDLEKRIAELTQQHDAFLQRIGAT
jgi:phage shock protein A